MTKNEEIMRAALEAIWENDVDDDDAFRGWAQKRALRALEHCGYAKPYLTVGEAKQ